MIIKRGPSLTKISDFIKEATKPITHHQSVSLLIGALILALLEITAYLQKSLFSFVAGRAWAILGLLYFISSLQLIIAAIKTDISEKNYIGFIAVAAVSFFVFYGIGNVNIINLNYEACQQAAAGLNSFTVYDWNYTGKGFLGYPMRQYLLVAVPSILFGRNAFALHLGYAFQFFAGILIWYSGMRTYFCLRYRQHPVWAAICITAVFLFPYLSEFSKINEQVILPVSYTMQCFGWFLLMLDKPSILNFICLAWIGAMLSTSYTPALASWILLLAALIFIVFYKIHTNKGLSTKNLISYINKPSIIAVISIWIYILTIGLCTFIQRSDRPFNMRIFNFNNIMKILIQTYKLFFFGDQMSFPGILSPLVIVYIILIFKGRLKLLDLFIILWSMAVTGISAILPGYATPSPELAMHRAMIIIPILMFGMIRMLLLWLNGKKITMKSSWIALLFALVLSLSSYTWLQPFKVFKDVAGKPMSFLVNDILEQVKDYGIHSDEPINILFYTNDVWKKNLKNYTDYFFPNADVIVMFNDNSIPDDIKNSRYILVYAEGQAKIPDEFMINNNICSDLNFRYKNNLYNFTRVVIINE